MAPRIFCFNILIFIHSFRYETIETHARTFLTLNILAIGRVIKSRLRTFFIFLNKHKKNLALFFQFTYLTISISGKFSIKKI